MKKIATGEDRHFCLVAPNNVTLSRYSAKYEIVGLLGIAKTGIVEKSTDNTKFEVKIDFEGVKPNRYELRVMVTDEIEDFTYTAYSEEIVIRLWSALNIEDVNQIKKIIRDAKLRKSKND